MSIAFIHGPGYRRRTCREFGRNISLAILRGCLTLPGLAMRSRAVAVVDPAAPYRIFSPSSLCV